MSENARPVTRGARVIACLVVVLLILHQDNWFWNDKTLVLGFMPIGLFWHVCISIAASLTWALATVIAWPMDNNSPEAAVEGRNREASS